MKKKKVLVCPLDWGLGHATRCIPIIEELLARDVEVIIAADARPLELLRKEFPRLKFIIFPGYSIFYPSQGNLIFSIFFQIPKILKGIWKEHRVLKKLIKDYDIESVISDNRYGLWNRKISSVFITHQFMIKCPRSLRIFEPVLHKLVLFFIKKYDSCWVPDFSGQKNLSGDLSHKYRVPKNVSFIGPLSRLKDEVDIDKEKIDLLIIISGPEPQRTVFEVKILEQLKNLNVSATIVLGKPEKEERKYLGDKIQVFSHVSASEMQRLVKSARLIICRSGYSTIMDLVVLNKKAVFIPTPGQTEQEYLAMKFSEEKICYTEDQASFLISAAIIASQDYKGFSDGDLGNSNLEICIDSFLLRL